ncbi:MAG: YkgJ family cysteine cluster protein [Thermoplasmata archaeon]|nr:YkgJ family cysteine cluster protein [Thermoplasmata archaeon]
MPIPPLDTTLLGGFRFRCLPGCGLCCFAEPALTATERSRLVTIEPELPVVAGETGGWSFVASRRNGGACALLTGSRCRAHAARPAPCSMFPVTVHVSDRAQATLVLSCPGLDAAGLLRWASGPPRLELPAGLEGEIASAREEWGRSGTRRELDRHRVRFRGRDGDDDVRAWRTEMHADLPWPERPEFPPEDPPRAEGELSELPVAYARSHGVVAFASHPGGWLVLTLSEAGDEPTTVGVVPPPDAPPPLTTTGRRMLQGYLHYLLERDDAIDAALAEPGPPGPVDDAIRADLVRTGATVLARASVLQRVEGRTGPLDAEDVWCGVRATDAEWLDRPTTGRRF